MDWNEKESKIMGQLEAGHMERVNALKGTGLKSFINSYRPSVRNAISDLNRDYKARRYEAHNDIEHAKHFINTVSTNTESVVRYGTWATTGGMLSGLLGGKVAGYVAKKVSEANMAGEIDEKWGL